MQQTMSCMQVFILMKLSQCDAYEIITLRNKPVSMQENPALSYGKVGSVNFV